MKSPILTSLTSGIIALAIALTVRHVTDELRQVLGADTYLTSKSCYPACCLP